MAIIACPECKGEVSTAASSCPKCGFPMVKETPAQPTPSRAAGGAPPRSETRSAAAPEPAYTPRKPQLKMQVGGVLFGLLLLGAGLYFALSWIPDHDITRLRSLGDVAGAAIKKSEFLEPDLVNGLTIGAWVCVLLGVGQLLTGSLKWDGRIGYCKKCDMSVNARKRMFVLRCERCAGRVTK